MAFVPSVLAFACSFTTGSEGHTLNQVNETHTHTWTPDLWALVSVSGGFAQWDLIVGPHRYTSPHGAACSQVEVPTGIEIQEHTHTRAPD